MQLTVGVWLGADVKLRVSGRTQEGLTSDDYGYLQACDVVTTSRGRGAANPSAGEAPLADQGELDAGVALQLKQSLPSSGAARGRAAPPATVGVGVGSAGDYRRVADRSGRKLPHTRFVCGGPPRGAIE